MKKDKQKNISGHVDISRNIVISMLALNVVIALFLFFLMNVVLKERAASLNEKNFIEYGLELRAASDLLTNSAREFVMTGNPKFLQDYWYEVNISKNRDNIIARLKELDMPVSEKALLLRAKRNSDDLITTEVRAMKLVLVAMGVPNDRMYPAISEYSLSMEDLSLSPVDKINLAQRIMFDANYLENKKAILEPLYQFKMAVEMRLNKMFMREKFYVNLIIGTLEMLSLLSFSIIFFGAVVGRLNVKEKLKPLFQKDKR